MVFTRLTNLAVPITVFFPGRTDGDRSHPPAGRSSAQPGTFQARVFPQYIDSLRNDGIRNWDAKILRKFTFHERIGLVLSVDLLNLTNHTQFSGPNITVTSPFQNVNGTVSGFGTVSGQTNAGRILQFATRFEF